MNRIHKILLTGVVLGSTFTAGAYADEVIQRVDAYLRPDFKLLLDGKKVELSGPPLVYQDRSYLPLKELGTMLGANITWEGDTRTIYINPRINEEQREEDDDAQYQVIEWSEPYSVKLRYLGAEYVVLLTSDEKQWTEGAYYREADVKRMGVDTAGLKKARERLSDELYIHESELRGRWRQTPEQVYDSKGATYLIAEEVVPEKIKALQEHVKATLTFQYSNIYYNSKPIIIDKLPGENQYRYYFKETVRLPNGTVTNQYYQSILKLSANTSVANTASFTVNTAVKTNLHNEADKRDAEASETAD